MQEEAKTEWENEILNFLRSYRLTIAAVFIFVVGFGLAFPYIFSKFFTLEQLDRLYAFTGDREGL